MNTAIPCAGKYQLSSLSNFSRTIKIQSDTTVSFNVSRRRSNLSLRACAEKKSGPRGFLTLEEAGLVEISGLSSHERFLCRLTVNLPQFFYFFYFFVIVNRFERYLV